MATVGEDIMSCKDVDQDQTFLQLSTHETIDDFQMPEVIVDPSSIDKELLRKIKRKERTKLNRKRKKALKRNLSQVNASELQQSVSALATTIGINTSSLVNDPLTSYHHQEAHMAQNFGSSKPVTDEYELLGNPIVVTDGAAGIRTGAEFPLCVLDASNFNARLSNLDLTYITEYLERNLFKDLTFVSKLKIDNVFLSASKRVWVICSSGTTSNWVTRRISEMPALNGRKYAVHSLAELEVLTQVSVLVPKECSLVNDYEDLMRFLALQNLGLSRGMTTLELKKRGPAERAMQDLANEDAATGEDTGAVKGADEGQNEVGIEDDVHANKADSTDCLNGFGASSLSNMKSGAISPLKQAPGNTTANCSTGSSSEVERQPSMPRSRTYVFYADDTWLMELRRLGCRPYLGARRLQCVIGERMVQRSQDGDAGPSKKRRRGGRRLAGGGLRNGKAEGEAGQDSTSTATMQDRMLSLG